MISVREEQDHSTFYCNQADYDALRHIPNVKGYLSGKKVKNGDYLIIIDNDNSYCYDEEINEWIKKKLILSDGTGGTGTDDYDDLMNKPSIGGIELNGDKSLAELGVVNYDDSQVKQMINNLSYMKQDKTDVTLDTTDKTIKGAINEIYDGLLDNVTFSSDYKNIILNRKGGNNPYIIPIASIIHNVNITELNDVDKTNIGDGKTLIYDSATKKHKYVDDKLTDELVKMSKTTDAKYLSELIDKNTVVNDNGVLKVKKLDGQEVTIAEINHLKGLTMNIVDLVKSFSSGGVKMYEHTIATYADLLALDRSEFVDGIRYFVYVLADETHEGIKTTYICDKTSTSYFGVAGDDRDFTSNPIDLVNEVTGKLQADNIDIDALWKLVTVYDTYKTLTTKNEPFGTHGAKKMYDELVAEIGEKANAADLTKHTDDTDIHITTAERTKWNDKLGMTDIATTIDENSTDENPAGARAVYEKIKNMVTTTVPDVGKTDITSKVSNATVNHNGGVSYSVKNGICYVQFTSVTTTTATNGSYIIPKGTLPALDTNLSNGRYPVVGGGAKSGMVSVDSNTGGIRYYGGDMTIFTTISYPVAEE